MCTWRQSAFILTTVGLSLIHNVFFYTSIVFCKYIPPVSFYSSLYTSPRFFDIFLTLHPRHTTSLDDLLPAIHIKQSPHMFRSSTRWKMIHSLLHQGTMLYPQQLFYTGEIHCFLPYLLFSSKMRRPTKVSLPQSLVRFAYLLCFAGLLPIYCTRCKILPFYR